MVTKKSEPWSMAISINTDSVHALAASLACEEVSHGFIDSTLNISVTGSSSSELRAKYNSTMRSIRAAVDVLDGVVV